MQSPLSHPSIWFSPDQGHGLVTITTLTTFAALATILFIASYLLWRVALPKPIPGIPYNPEALQSIFGDFPAFKKWHDKRPELYSWIVSQSVKLNSPVIQVFMRPLSRPWVVLADFYEAEDIMARRTKDFGRADMFGDFFAPLLPHSHIHLPMNDEWRAHRRLIGDVVSPDFLNQVAGPQIYDRILATMELWKEKARLAEGRPFWALKDVTYGALEVMWAVAFGSNVGATEAQTALLSQSKEMQLPQSKNTPVEFPVAKTSAGFNAVVTLTTSVEVALKSPFPRPTYTFALKFLPRLRRAMKDKNILIQERLDEAWKKASKQGDKEDMRSIKSATDLIVSREVAKAKKEGRKPQYDTAVIKDELFGLLVAGLDTTSITVCWGLKFLTAHPRVQERLRSILRETFQAASECGDIPTVEEIVNANIPYLDAIIEESHRLGGTASIGTRVALRDTEILGVGKNEFSMSFLTDKSLQHFIPKGTDVFTLSQGPSYVSPPIAVDESKRTANSTEATKKWGTWEPDTISEYLPERWLKSDGKGGMQFNPFAGPAHPFGAGPRGCFGRKFASLELKIIMSLVVWTFYLKEIPEELSSFSAQDLMVHTPQQCYLRLEPVA